MNNDDGYKFLLRNAQDEREATFLYLLENGSEKADAAEEAGYSAGRSKNPLKRRKALQTVASRLLQKGRVIQLRKDYRQFRKHGPSKIAPPERVLERLTEMLESSRDTAVVSAASRILEYHRRAPLPQDMPTGVIVGELIRRGGKEKARELLEVFAPNLLPHVDAYDPAQHDTELVEALNREGSYDAELSALDDLDEEDDLEAIADDMDRRLTALEAR